MVLALVRGGVPVAVEVAKRLYAPLDLVLLRRLLLPGGPGTSPLCVFNVAGTRVLDPALSLPATPPSSGLDFYLADALAEFARREEVCRRGRPPVELRGKTVLLVDNGVRTGGTLRAAIRAVRTRQPARIVAAVPVAAAESRSGIEAHADEVVCLAWNHPFGNVALGYRDFRVPGVEQVGEMLDETAGAVLAPGDSAVRAGEA